MSDDSRGRPHDGRAAVLERIRGICDSCIETAAVDGVGVSVLSSARVPVAVYVTNEQAGLLEDLQMTLGEGPCVDATRGGGPVLVADLTSADEGIGDRWPAFVDEALAAGVRSVFAFPIRVGAINLGTVDLYRREPSALSGVQLRAALDSVDSIGWRLLDLDTASGDEHEMYHLLVHQAAGMIKVQLGTSLEDAMARLRATAYLERVPLNELAADIVQGTRRFGKESL